MNEETKQATELEYLQWFYRECDFGPAHEDVVNMMNTEFTRDTGKTLPEGYINE